MGFGDSLSAAEDREGWKGIVTTSSVVPRRPPRLRDGDEMNTHLKENSQNKKPCPIFGIVSKIRTSL